MNWVRENLEFSPPNEKLSPVLTKGMYQGRNTLTVTAQRRDSKEKIRLIFNDVCRVKGYINHTQ